MVNSELRQMKEGAEKRAKVAKILADMKEKMKELEDIRMEITRKQFEGIDPKKSKAMLEEIKVPSIKLIREHRA